MCLWLFFLLVGCCCFWCVTNARENIPHTKSSNRAMRERHHHHHRRHDTRPHAACMCVRSAAAVTKTMNCIKKRERWRRDRQNAVKAPRGWRIHGAQPAHVFGRVLGRVWSAAESGCQTGTLKCTAWQRQGNCFTFVSIFYSGNG